MISSKRLFNQPQIVNQTRCNKNNFLFYLISLKCNIFCRRRFCFIKKRKQSATQIISVGTCRKTQDSLLLKKCKEPRDFSLGQRGAPKPALCMFARLRGTLPPSWRRPYSAIDYRHLARCISTR